MFIPKHKELFIMDWGNSPLIINIDKYAKANQNYRTALWTGVYLQTTLMSIPVGESIGFERHGDLDQFIRIESGKGFVEMGPEFNNLIYKKPVNEDYAIIIPAGTWHNITNIGSTPLKLYSIYAPPHHPFGTVHKTKADAEALED